MSKLYAIKVTEDNELELTSWVVSHEDFDKVYLPIEGYVTQNPQNDFSYQIWCPDISRYHSEYEEVTIEEFFKNK